MTKPDLNKLPEQLRLGLISEKEAVNQICKFVVKNYPIYGLHKYDEDFRQDIILSLIERAPHILQVFNPDFGDFLTFLYCHISTLINTRLKNKVMQSMRDKLNFEECIQMYEEKELQYLKIDYKNFDMPKVPFAHKKLDANEFQKIFKSLSPSLS